MGLLGAPRQAASPATVPTDTVIPFHFYDDTKNTRGICFDVTFRFDDVLDPKRLRGALSRLLELGNWRKLGARIRRNGRGGLEYHVPRYFDDERPGFAFSVATFESRIDEHPQASRFIRPLDLDSNGLPLTFAIPSVSTGFKSFCRTPGFPDRLHDWLHSDSGQLGIHVMLFQDATLVTVSFLHSLTDMMGLKAILTAWTAVLCGREDLVEPFVGFSEDPLAGLGKRKNDCKPKYVFSDMLITGWSWILFLLRYYFSIEMLWKRREEDRIVFLPARRVQRMRQQAMDELAVAETSNADRSVFISEGDVVFAWWARLVLRAQALPPDRTVHMRNTCCCRSLLKELGLLPPGSSALVSNAVFGALTFLSVRQVQEKPLAFTAHEIRKALIEQRTAEQFEALDAIRRDSLANAGHPAVFGRPDMYMLMISSWAKARLFELDFSAAVLRRGETSAERKNPLGRPSCIQGRSTRDFATRNTGVVIGKDAGGNYWLSYTLQKEAWRAVEQQFLSMPDEEAF
ncbi:hypothetical protein E4U42_002771 [Claviceps africana]|uniref:LysR family regulatory protein n=1 Tax=Claviceps africana TaxID=83212 RepID=A0A8K0JAH8_9HYPO|nr:hypothetical protein E4U42_002771 [Claviceps africana]